MGSKDWKWLVVAPMCVLALAACEKRTSQKKTDASSFTGVWVQEDTVARYLELQREPMQFCQVILQNPRRYQVVVDQELGFLRLDAWLVQPDGNVYIYRPNQFMDATYRQHNLHGNVNNSGHFRLNRGHGYWQAGGYDPRNPRTWVVDSTFYKDGDRLIVQGSTARVRYYRRIQDHQLRQLNAAVAQCSRLIAVPEPEPGGVYGRPGEAIEERRRVTTGRRVTRRGAPLPQPLPPQQQFEEEDLPPVDDKE